jgi:hypothetical protein
MLELVVVGSWIGEFWRERSFVVSYAGRVSISPGYSTEYISWK